MPIAEEIAGLPFEAAIAYLRDKVNVTTRGFGEVRDAANAHAFYVSGAASDALVADFRAEIDRALAEGTTLEDFRQAFDDIVTRHGWRFKGEPGWRARIIFETNMNTAYAAGRHVELVASADIFPYWIYRHSGAANPRRQHLNWDGQAWRHDDPVWRVAYPPNDFGCGCWVEPADDFDLEQMGKSAPDEAPDLRLPGGGFQGIDDTFAYNPGQAWLDGPQAEP